MSSSAALYQPLRGDRSGSSYSTSTHSPPDMGKNVLPGTQARAVDGQGYVHDDDDDNRSSLSSYDQTGVKNIEAISQTWTRWSLICAYIG